MAGEGSVRQTGELRRSLLISARTLAGRLGLLNDVTDGAAPVWHRPERVKLGVSRAAQINAYLDWVEVRREAAEEAEAEGGSDPSPLPYVDFLYGPELAGATWAIGFGRELARRIGDGDIAPDHLVNMAMSLFNECVAGQSGDRDAPLPEGLAIEVKDRKRYANILGVYTHDLIEHAFDPAYAGELFYELQNRAELVA